MTKVKVLIQGYARKTKTGWIASSTVCLIETGDKKIITDPGCNRAKLLIALKKQKLAPKNIDYVFLSHCHPDHILMAGIFTKAKFITYDWNMVYDKDRMYEFEKDFLGPDVEIIDTPGHVTEHLSLLVKTSKGRLAIAGDAIWWPVGKQKKFKLDQRDLSEAKELNMKKLIVSRRKIIKDADWVIPGHGKVFKVNDF